MKEGRKGGRKGCCSGVEERRYPTLTDKRMYLLKLQRALKHYGKS
jgi:hypothetical protein